MHAGAGTEQGGAAGEVCTVAGQGKTTRPTEKGAGGDARGSTRPVVVGEGW